VQVVAAGSDSQKERRTEMKYLVSDTITEFRTYEVEADSYEDAAELVDQHATDKPEDLTGGLVLVNRGITDRFQQDET
jgi:hypothetical protein